MNSEVETPPPVGTKHVQDARMDDSTFLVQWDEHPSHLASRLGYLLEHQSLVDVTLMCNTHTLKVHRAVLAACSPYFERQLGNHPLIVLKDMKFSVLKSLVEFMYCGETSVSEENLTPLLEAAKFFEVKGLAAMTKETVCVPGSSTPKSINGTSFAASSNYRGSGRGRGRGRGRPPLSASTKVASPTESAQILLSLSGNNTNPSQQQFLTTSKNVKIDPSVIQNNGNDKQKVANFEPRRRGRRRGAINSAFREKLLRDADTQQAIENLKRDLSDDGEQLASPLLSSLLNKPDKDDPNNSNKYLQTLKDFGLPTNVPILLDNGEGNLVTLTEDVLKSVIDRNGSIQFHVTGVEESPSSSGMEIVDGPFVEDRKDKSFRELFKQKKPRQFVVKEMQATRSDEEDTISTQVNLDEIKVEQDSADDYAIQEAVLESLKQGAANEAENDPEAVVLFEVTGDKKVEKCVVSAREVHALKVLNEQLTKQKKQLADMTRNSLSTFDVGTNTKMAELKLRIGRTKSILSQVMERAQQGLREKLKNYTSQFERNDERKPTPQSQVVQLEFIDGNGEKIEGYQVEGTVVDKRLSDSKESLSKDSDLLGLFDMVCGSANPLMDDQMSKIDDKRSHYSQDSGLDSSKDMGYHLVMNNHLEDHSENISYDQIEAMISDSDGNIVIEHKPQDFKYVIDNAEAMHEDSYVVYDDGEKQIGSNEFVIYGNTDTVLSGIQDHEGADHFVVEDENEVTINNDEGTEYIVYGDDKSDLSNDMKDIDSGDVSTQYIVYDTVDHDKASKYEIYKGEDDEESEGQEREEMDKAEDEFIYSGDKDRMLAEDPKRNYPANDVPFDVDVSQNEVNSVNVSQTRRRTKSSSSPTHLPKTKRRRLSDMDKSVRKKTHELVLSDQSDSESL